MEAGCTNGCTGEGKTDVKSDDKVEGEVKEGKIIVCLDPDGCDNA